MQGLIKLLHVEDNPIDAEIIERELNHQPKASPLFQIMHVNCLSQALQVLKDDHFSAVLLDLNLPDGFGIETLQRFHEYYPELPVIVMTGCEGEALSIQALQEGAQEYMVKGNITGAVLNQIIQSSIFRKKIENNLQRQAHYDELTGLPNRPFFEDYAHNILKRAERWKTQHALLFIDLDGFKSVNDTHGHVVGNLVLRKASQRIKLALRESDMIARYGGDEFVVLIDHNDQQCVTEADCTQTSAKIHDAFRKPFRVENNNIHLGCSIGVALYPECGETLESLISYADKAMYMAKRGNHDVSWLTN